MTSRGLEFDLTPPAIEPVGGLVTTADFSVLVDGEALWPVAGAPHVRLEIQVDDLLSHLVECWQPLALRQTYPISVAVDRPLSLRAEAEKRWEQQPAEVAEREDEIVSNFEDVHDLSKCFAGYFDLPPLWLMRRGEKLIVDTRAGVSAVDFASAWAEVSRLGDQIAAHLETAGERWSRLVDGWRNRDKVDPLSLLAWSTSLNRATAEELARDGVLAAPSSFTDAANDNDELRIAARMASALPPDQIRGILEIVKSFPKVPAPKLDKLAGETTAYIAAHFANRRAHEQGEAAARYVREKADLPAEDPCDIADLMRRLGVDLHPRSVEPAALRALAVWGNRHGPAVLLNVSRKTLRRLDEYTSDGRARVNMAHELCHLLIDRGHALGAVEILNSRMPLDIERRAKSFAGELLLPAEVAAEEWRRQGAPRSLTGLKKLVRELQERFGVSDSVAAWKLEHGLQRRDIDVSVLLDVIAPAR